MALGNEGTHGWKRNLIIIGIVGSFLIWALANYFVRPAIVEPYYLTWNDSLYYQNGIAANEGIRYIMHINYTTYDVFSARTPLAVDAAIFTNVTIFNQNLWIYFPDATNVPPRFHPNGTLLIPEIKLDKYPDGIYRGSETIQYRSAGEKYIAFAPYAQSRIPYKQNGTTIITISGEDSKHQFEANKATVSLGFAAIGLAVAASYAFIDRILDQLPFSRKRRANSSRQNDSKKK